MCIQFPLWLSDFISAHSGGLCAIAAVVAFVGLRVIIPDNL